MKTSYKGDGNIGRVHILRFRSAFFWKWVMLFTLCSISHLAAAEDARWTQLKADCGLPSSTAYNTWVSNGSPCPAKSGGTSSGSGMTPQEQLLMQGAGALGAAFGNYLRESMTGNPQEEERKAQEAAERQRLIELQRQEGLRQQEQAKQRVLGLLKGTESSGDLGLKMDSDQPLTVTTERGAFGSTAIVPVSPGVTSASGLQLKLGDDAEQSSVAARRGFDTAGKMQGAGLPAPPAPLATHPIANHTKIEKMNTLKAALKKNDDEEKTLKALLEKLRQSPNPDETAIKDVQQKIEANEDDKKKIEKQLLDLTAEDDNAGAGQLQDNPSAMSGK